MSPTKNQSGAWQRIFDLVLAVPTIIVFAPAIVGIAFAIRFALGSPVIFKQERIGLGNRSFFIYKFRTMTDACDKHGRQLPDAERLTRFGCWLRKTSLDELPELWNILKGEMSFVGPRPLLPQYLPRYSTEQIRRHLVRPGMTGWAQVNGRNNVPWQERFELDVWYVDNRSILLDAKILLQTIACVLSRRGVNAAQHVTMPEFEGNIVSDDVTTSSLSATKVDAIRHGEAA